MAEFFEIMDPFLGCSDKVSPKSVKQTQLLENKKNRESENLDKEEATKDLAVMENCKDGTSPGEDVPQQRSRKRKRCQEEGQVSESDKALFNLLLAQQESIQQSERPSKQ